MADSFDTLARAHMAQQVREAGTIQAALSTLWDKTIDPTDFAASYGRFREASLPLIGAGRLRGEALSQTYYSGVMQVAGYSDPLAAVARQPLDFATTKSVLTKSVDPVYTQFQIGRGSSTALATAKSGMLGAAKRQVLAGGRQRLIAVANGDKNVRGWARVSDGSPCAFCSMLVSRGPVYSVTSVHFRAHIRCGCSVRLVPQNDPTGGWSPDALAYKKLFENAGGDPGVFRSALALARATPATVAAPSPLDVFTRLAKAETYTDAARVSNPGYLADAGSYGNNCHQVVNAMELRARGYDVIAKPTIEIQGRASFQTAADWLNADGSPAEFRTLNSFGDTYALRDVKLALATEDWPVGARGYVSGQWRKGGGHIFNVEKTDKGLVFYEGQVASVADSEAGDYLAQMDSATVKIIRSDNLVATDGVLDSVDAATPELIDELKSWRPDYSDRTDLEQRFLAARPVVPPRAALERNLVAVQSRIDKGEAQIAAKAAQIAASTPEFLRTFAGRTLRGELAFLEKQGRALIGARGRARTALRKSSS